MTLGSKLFNQMLENYKNIMPRKRAYFSKPRLYKEDYATKEELENLVWKMPLNKVSEYFGISVDYVKKWCNEWNILKIRKLVENKEKQN